jgi:hypothetical protein
MINPTQEKSFKALIKKFSGFSDNQVDSHFYILKHNKISNLINLNIDNEVDKCKISGKFVIEMRNWNKGMPIYDIRFLQIKAALELSNEVIQFLEKSENQIFKTQFNSKTDFSCLINNHYHTFDFELNRSFTCLESEIKIPTIISNYVLKPFEIQALKIGFPILLKDIYNEKKNVIHDSIIQIDAIKKGLKFTAFDDINIGNKKVYSRFFNDGALQFLFDEYKRNIPKSTIIKQSPIITEKCSLIQSQPRISSIKINF